MIRWPWVSRLLVEATEDRAKRAETQHDQLLGKYEALLVRYHALKMAGAQDVPPAEPAERPEPDLAIQAAIAHAGSNHRLAAHLVGRVRMRRASNESTEDIIRHIIEGQPDDPATVGVGD